MGRTSSMYGGDKLLQNFNRKTWFEIRHRKTRWEDNIKTDPKKRDCENLDCIPVSQDGV
jgi:hypothetical protein